MTFRMACALLAVCSTAVFVAACARGPTPLRMAAARPVAVDQRDARDILDAYRRSHGLGALQIDPALAAAAGAQAMAMAGTGELSHTVAGSLADRLAAAHAASRSADENVSGGYTTADAAFAGWRRSPPHDANLLDPKMMRMGIGSAYSDTARYHQYWSLILAD